MLYNVLARHEKVQDRQIPLINRNSPQVRPVQFWTSAVSNNKHLIRTERSVPTAEEMIKTNPETEKRMRRKEELMRRRE